MTHDEEPEDGDGDNLKYIEMLHDKCIKAVKKICIKMDKDGKCDDCITNVALNGVLNAFVQVVSVEYDVDLKHSIVMFRKLTKFTQKMVKTIKEHDEKGGSGGEPVSTHEWN